MKVFLVGDYRTGSGPANVTAKYKEKIEHVMVQRMRSKPFRLMELMLKIPFCDVVLLSGHSAQNIHAIRIAHRLHKKAAFLMHGCVEHENEINGVPDAYMTQTERWVLKESDAIYAVSGRFGAWLKERYPEYASKISAIPNGIDLKDVGGQGAKPVKKAHQILSIGGGMPRKRIRYIAEAVGIVRKDPAFSDTSLVVIGEKGLDTDAVNAYSFVRNLGRVPFARSMELLKESALFVQNSCFETFGLAPVEALAMGTSVLLSKEVGALEIFGSVEEDDLITDTKDPKEIAEKIKKILQQPNHDRLLAAIDTESVSWDKRCSLLMEKLRELTAE